jgi:hypothetical protein
MRTNLPLGILVFALLPMMSACTSPLHLAYDYGRSYTQTFTAQPDLTRPSAANAAYGLAGTEAAAIRLNAPKESTDKETEESTFSTGG